MLYEKFRIRTSEQGFTLIELLVVITIIGVLSAIALPIFLGQQLQAARATVKSDVTNTAIEVGTYVATNGVTADPTLAHVVATKDNVIRVVKNADPNFYTVCGMLLADPDGWTYGFDSSTGQTEENLTICEPVAAMAMAEEPSEDLTGQCQPYATRQAVEDAAKGLFSTVMGQINSAPLFTRSNNTSTAIRPTLPENSCIKTLVAYVSLNDYRQDDGKIKAGTGEYHISVTASGQTEFMTTDPTSIDWGWQPFYTYSVVAGHVGINGSLANAYVTYDSFGNTTPRPSSLQ